MILSWACWDGKKLHFLMQYPLRLKGGQKAGGRQWLWPPGGSLVARAPAPWTRAVEESAEARNLGPRILTPISTEVSSPPEAPQGPRCTGRLLSRSQSISPLCPGPQSHIPTLAPRAPWHCLSGPRAEAFRKPLPPSKRKGRGDWEGEGLPINISTNYSIA